MELFKSAQECDALIKKYFKNIKGRFHLDTVISKNTKASDQEKLTLKVWDKEPEPPLFSGLALALGFASLQEFEAYSRNGEHKALIKRAKLQVEAGYERKLHQQAPTGAIFALKTIGWNEREEPAVAAGDTETSMVIRIINTGPNIASSEKEVEI